MRSHTVKQRRAGAGACMPSTSTQVHALPSWAYDAWEMRLGLLTSQPAR